MRIRQPTGSKGSLKWIQHAINQQPDTLNTPISRMLLNAAPIAWLSPLVDHGYAEYRDSSFLELIGHPELADQLSDFWPRRGPQWDALGKTANGEVLLVEAKAHIDEICSDGSDAGPASRSKIEAALAETILHLRAKPRAPWIDTFFQLANRLAHLHFLRRNGVDARLVLVNFIDDVEMRGPSTPAEWEAAYRVVYHVMGIPARSQMATFVHHIYPSVKELTSSGV